LTDRQGLSLARSEPVSGNHNDLYGIEVQFEEVIATLEEADISVEGLFINADAGFDSKELRKKCEAKGMIVNIRPNKRNGDSDNDYYYDEELYKQRYAIERTNAWMDGFRSILNRFDIIVSSWKGFNYCHWYYKIYTSEKVKITSIIVFIVTIDFNRKMSPEIVG
jgi:hypothetical protein